MALRLTTPLAILMQWLLLASSLAPCRGLLAGPLTRSTSRNRLSTCYVAPATAGAKAETPTDADDLARTKAKLLGWISPKSYVDPVLADPVTKEPLSVSLTTSTVVEDASRRRVRFLLRAAQSNQTYSGSSETYINLLEPSNETAAISPESSDGRSGPGLGAQILRGAAPLLPPPLRPFVDRDYVPMRDLFTSPAVSFAYERGWRQGFRQAGFPGPDREAAMAMEYFAPVVTAAPTPGATILVDMSCATGLFTRRFAQSSRYGRVLGCDYSDSMLREARRRLRQEGRGGTSPPVAVELIRLDVGQIPMQNESVDVLHAGAAMHCWPDLPAAVAEIHRVLRPGGRYFATTFLSSYFANLRTLQGDAAPSRQAFQYFASADELRTLMENGGFRSGNVDIEILQPACVVIRCQKD